MSMRVDAPCRQASDTACEPAAFQLPGCSMSTGMRIERMAAYRFMTAASRLCRDRPRWSHPIRPGTWKTSLAMW